MDPAEQNGIPHKIEVRQMKSKEEIKKEMEANRENFYRMTLCELRKNNPDLEEFMWRAIKTTKTKDLIQIKIVRLAIVVLRAIGATDKKDPDFIRVSKDTIEKMERYELWKNNIPSVFRSGQKSSSPMSTGRSIKKMT